MRGGGYNVDRVLFLEDSTKWNVYNADMKTEYLCVCYDLKNQIKHICIDFKNLNVYEKRFYTRETNIA